MTFLKSRLPRLLAIAALAAACTSQPSASAAPASVATSTASAPAAASSTAAPTATASPVAVPAGTEPRALSFVDESTGFAVASRFGRSGGSILATTDGGKTWAVRSSLDIYPAGGLTQLRFVDATNGWLLTNVLLPGTSAGCAPPSTAPNECRTVIFKTSDGGRTWREQLSVEQPSKLGPGLRALAATDAQHAWAVRLGDDLHSVPTGFCDPFNCSRELVATTDGEQWATIATLPAFAEQLDFVDARTGWATVHTSDNGEPTVTSTVLSTSDGGHSWSPQLSATQPHLGQFQVDFVDARRGWALLAGSQGDDCGRADVGPIPCTSYALYRTTDGGSSWAKPEDSKPPTAWWSPLNNVSTLGAPHFVDGSEGWIPITYDGQHSGGVLLTKDGGTTWSRVYPGNLTDSWDVHEVAVAGALVWVAGERSESEGAWFIARSDTSGIWTYQLVSPPFE